MIPILKNNSTAAPAVSHPHPNSTQARIARALEEFPGQDPHFLPQGPSASESRTWFRDIVNRFWTDGYRCMSRQHDSFYEQVLVANKENIPICHSQVAGVNAIEQSSRLRWPKEVIPPEIFENIATFLPRDCLENMRLVNKEFEFKISPSIFRHVVIPFTPQNFGEQRPQGPSGQKEKRKCTCLTGMSKYYASFAVIASAYANNNLENKGMHAFRGFGHHILKFGVSFEVDEGTYLVHT
jgi:hypothetical protein